MYDVAIIGAGASGCSIARELSRLDCSICMVEREEDVCCGTSKANSAIVHAGFDAKPGSLMARLNVEGNRLMRAWASELDFDLMPVGSLVVCTDEGATDGLEVLRRRGETNGVPDLRIIGRDELVSMEPNVSDAAVAALWAPTGCIVDPFGLTVALAENAAANGVEFRFNAAVTDITGSGDHWLVTAGGQTIEARAVVNAAGVYADAIHALFIAAAGATSPAAPVAVGAGLTVPAEPLTIVPRKGEYYLLDTTAGRHVRHTVFTLPTAMGKGVLVSPTVHGNLIVGPTATDVEDKEATQTTAEGLAELAARCSIAVRDVPLREVITTFAGLRAHQAAHDFVIGELEAAAGLFDCAAIESPGLTSAPAIGVLVSGLVAGRLGLVSKSEGAFDPVRHGIPDLERLDLDEWDALCRRDPAYGSVVCRCRRVSEAQIVDVIHSVPPATSLDAIKRRTNAMMGRCQGGFCTPKVMEVLVRELGVAPEEVTKCGPGSELVMGRIKDGTAMPPEGLRGGGPR